MAADRAARDMTAAKADIYKYAVVDLAIAEQLRPAVLGQLRTVAAPLLARNAPLQVQEVGPWIVRLSMAPEVERTLDRIAPDLPWGFYIHASVDLFSLRQTLRRFNFVALPDVQKPVLFRYWDPRVMAMFLDIATRDQRARLFDFVDRIEAPDGSFDRRATDP